MAGDKKRIVYIEPGDTLFIGNLFPLLGEQDFSLYVADMEVLTDTLKKFGFDQVLFFGQDITLDSSATTAMEPEGRPKDLYEKLGTALKCEHCEQTTNLAPCSRCNKYWCPGSFYKNELHPCARKR